MMSAAVSCNQSIIPKRIPKSRIKMLKTRENDRNSNLSEGSDSGANKLGHVLVGFGMRRPSEIFDHY